MYGNDITAYLLARLISIQTGEQIADILKDAQESVGKMGTETVKKSATTEQIEDIYSLYPTKCPVSGRPLGKTTKDKDKIATRIKELGYEEVKYRVLRYMTESQESGTYFKNFRTFLNNIPDYSHTEPKAVQTEMQWQ